MSSTSAATSSPMPSSISSTTAAPTRLSLDANVSGVAQLVASGIAKVESTGTVTARACGPNSFDLLTRSGGDEFTIKVQLPEGRRHVVHDQPAHRQQYRSHPGRAQAAQRRQRLPRALHPQGRKLDRRSATTRQRSSPASSASISISAMRGTMSQRASAPATRGRSFSAPSSTSRSPGTTRPPRSPTRWRRTTASSIWFAPLGDSGYAIPYRVLLTTSMGDLSMVLTRLK